MILFIAAMLVAASVAGTLVTSVGDVSGSIDARSADAAQTIDTEVDIISDPGSEAVYDDSTTTVTLLVKNTGNGRLPADASKPDVLVDGQYVGAADRTLTVVSGSEWRSGNVVRLELTADLDPGEHRVVLIVNGDREVFEFYV
ncbi:flagellar protein FlaG [Haloarchaeobius iranensis]|uniref:Flagellar protein FlaG n=2 Tax=Haloarchaeobius iranensis TaxID=996166 RepID=A0A1G9ZHA0_9EURY|nr:flagellar protein FlaG [Haloarchaeobius iranensis]